MPLTHQQIPDIETPDFQVFWTTKRWGKRRIGRIRLATERVSEGETWTISINLPLPIPAYGHAIADSKKEAISTFKERWTRFLADHSEKDLEDAFSAQDNAGPRPGENR